MDLFDEERVVDSTLNAFLPLVCFTHSALVFELVIEIEEVRQSIHVVTTYILQVTIHLLREHEYLIHDTLAPHMDTFGFFVTLLDHGGLLA